MSLISKAFAPDSIFGMDKWKFLKLADCIIVTNALSPEPVPLFVHPRFGGAEVAPIARARWVRHEPIR
jgi:hypothetical protein